MAETKQELAEVSESTGFATEKDVDHIVRNPRDYGFDWDDSWSVASETDVHGKKFATGKVTMVKNFAVIPKVTDGRTFVDAFGWESLEEAYNETSGRVKAQGIVRTMVVAEWYKDHAKAITLYVARVEVVKRVLLRIRAKGGGGGGRWFVDLEGNQFRTMDEVLASNKRIGEKFRTFPGMDGVQYKTALEARQASVAWLMAAPRNMSHEMAVQLVANMPE